MDGRRRALLSVPFGYASLHCEQGTPIPLANDLQLFNFRWQSLFKFGWQWTTLGILGLGLQESIDIPVDLQLVDDVDRQLNGLEDGCTTFAFPASLLCDEIEVSFHNSV